MSMVKKGGQLMDDVGGKGKDNLKNEMKRYFTHFLISELVRLREGSGWVWASTVDTDDHNCN